MTELQKDSGKVDAISQECGVLLELGVMGKVKFPRHLHSLCLALVTETHP